VRTWHIESAVVFIVLFVITAIKNFENTEIVCSLAVWLTFMHGQVADRMQEKQAQMAKPDVDCYKWSNRYFLMKEALWITFFIMIGSFAALAGSVLFFMYPFWRKIYKKKWPKL